MGKHVWNCVCLHVSVPVLKQLCIYLTTKTRRASYTKGNKIRFAATIWLVNTMNPVIIPFFC